MSEDYDFIGIGVGVANLSLAALIENKSDQRYVFLEEKPHFSWHEYTLLPMAEIQTNPIQDIVTPAEPTNPYSFLNYLFHRGILYSYFNNKANPCTRRQFNDYLCWVSRQVKGLQFGVTVESLDFDGELFVVQTSQGRFSSKHVILGCGIKPKLPACAHGVPIAASHHHSFHHLRFNPSYQQRSVAVIGGGQSGAELFYKLVASNQPASVYWISQRAAIVPLEDSCFTNEVYTPNYVQTFYQFEADVRHQLNNQFLYTSDGITQSLSDKIYNILYNNKYFPEQAQQTTPQVHTHTKLVEVARLPEGYQLQTQCLLTGELNQFRVDDVIYATGFRARFPEVLSRDLLDQYPQLAALQVNFDYSLAWEHQQTNKIFIQNGARQTHGVADPNLILAAWRSSMIVNALTEKQLFKTQHYQTVL